MPQVAQRQVQSFGATADSNKHERHQHQFANSVSNARDFLAKNEPSHFSRTTGDRRIDLIFVGQVLSLRGCPNKIILNTCTFGTYTIHLPPADAKSLLLRHDLLCVVPAE